jgi:hypothetical protein
MSVKATNWAWHLAPEEIAGNDLIVLMALADIADDDGDVVHGDPKKRRQEVLAEKSRVSLATFKRSIAALAEDFGVLSVKRTGRENRYKLRLEVMRPSTAPETVDNPGEAVETRSLNLSYQASVELSDSSTVSSRGKHLNKDLNGSSRKITTGAAALRADDEDVPARLGIRGRLRLVGDRRHLNIPELNAAIGKYFTDVAGGENERGIVYRTALSILGKAAEAKTLVADPTRYVIAAVEAEPEVWRKRAFRMDVRP